MDKSGGPFSKTTARWRGVPQRREREAARVLVCGAQALYHGHGTQRVPVAEPQKPFLEIHRVTNSLVWLRGSAEALSGQIGTMIEFSLRYEVRSFGCSFDYGHLFLTDKTAKIIRMP